MIKLAIRYLRYATSNFAIVGCGSERTTRQYLQAEPLQGS